jgi:signal transduction histidine kinase
MDPNKALLFSETLNKKHRYFSIFSDISRSMGFELVLINSAEQALAHLRSERSSVLICDEALLRGNFKKSLEELGDRNGIVLLSTGGKGAAMPQFLIDSVVVLSLPEDLFALSVGAAFKHMLLKNYAARKTGSINAELLKKLLSDVAHAVNNILSGMQGYAELAQLNPDDTKLIQDSLNVVLFSSQRVKQEIKNLRALVRVENPDTKPVNISDVIEPAIALEKNQIMARKVHFKHGLDNGTMIQADHDQLIQVFYNLLNDVVSNTAEGGTVSLTSGAEQDTVAVSICGNPYDMSDDEFASYKNIFNLEVPLLQSADQEGKIDYRSILSICSRIVKNHGGKIDLSRTKKGDVVYTVELPLLQEKEKESALEKMYEEVVYENINNLDMDILVVDDEEYVRNTIYYFFDKKGCRVTVAEDGEYGFDIAKNKPFDLIFMDYLMPKMGGMESARKIMEKNKDVRIVFITGRESLDEDDLYKAGIYACIKKPFEMKDLFDIAKRIAFQKGIVE